MATNYHSENIQHDEDEDCRQAVGLRMARRHGIEPFTGTKTVKVPKVFYIDHRERDLDAGTVIHETARHFTVEADLADLAEMLSDAEHYAWLGTAELGQESFGLVSSARATAKAIRKAVQ